MNAIIKTLSAFFVVLLFSVSELSFAAQPTILGDWTLNYDWGCDGSYSSTTINLNSNKSFSTSEGLSGKWVLVAGMLMFQFDTLTTTYSGTRASRSVTGISSTFGSLNGCFSMSQSEPLTLSESVKQEVRNASGQ